jgi:membrane protein DedA with SNARE-associated domain
LPAELVEFLIIATATFVSEDLTCVSTGMAAAAGRTSLLLGIAACTAGIFAGDLLLFAAGRLGRPALARAPLRFFVSAEAVDRATAWFAKKGRSAILVSRFVPGLRLPTYVAAGIVRMPLSHFLPWFALGAVIWTPLLVLASFFLGQRLTEFTGMSTSWLLGGSAVLLYLILRLTLQLSTWRGRMAAKGWLLRWRWEYWPSWAVYPPVVVYCLYLAVRFRGAFLFTCCNPGIPASGITGESKSDILVRLNGPEVARFAIVSASLPTSERTLQAGQIARKWGWPLVIKPDRGQRGSGVTIVRDEGALEGVLLRVDGPQTECPDFIVQEYAPGLEFGVFYARRPSETNGRIISITRKVLPELKGDGRRSLEELILADPRAVALAPQYFRANKDRLDYVPHAEETVRLVDLGTHSRGAIFLDGMYLLTPELASAVDRISKRFDGFFLGRYDIKCPDEKSFRAGRNLRVLELNGATSEPTHIYDPAVSIIAAYRALFEQWRLEYEIGSENRMRGARPLSAMELIQLLRTGRPPAP